MPPDAECYYILDKQVQVLLLEGLKCFNYIRSPSDANGGISKQSIVVLHVRSFA